MSRTAAAAVGGARFVLQRLVLRPLVRSQVSVDVEGAEHVRDLPRPYVVVANHSSHLDAPLVLGALPLRVSQKLAVAAAADYFFDARWRATLTGLVFNAFPVDRDGTRGNRGLAAQLLDEGTPLLLFPEGTRSKDGTMAPFKVGAAALAVTRGVPVVPVGLVGAHDAMPRGRSWPLPGRPPVKVVVGEPLHPHEGETPRAFTQRIALAVERLVHGEAEADGEGEGGPGVVPVVETERPDRPAEAAPDAPVADGSTDESTDGTDGRATDGGPGEEPGPDGRTARAL
ncbi:lysophospholipid acyltransferase family protein [Pseudokineococcus basanitobsidens]|uniref:Lysophospholipid acyltransferase family protein n=1 Tax=Pseudokineococcus basanitobsidens TaxID=1926649 RepID=A0ABU8RMF3_9ACTN